MKTYREFIREGGNYAGTGAVTGMGDTELGIHVSELILSDKGVEHEDELLWPLFRRYEVFESVDNTGIDDAIDVVEAPPKGPFGKPGASEEDKAILAKHKDQQDPIWPMVDEDIGNTAGSGAIAGIGVGPQGEPGVDVKNDDELSSRSRAAKKPIWPMMKRKKVDEAVTLNSGEINILDLFVTETLYLKGANVGKVKKRISAEQVRTKVIDLLLTKKMIDFKVNTNVGDGYAATPLGFEYWKKNKSIHEDMFAGAEVFDVSHDVFAKCRLGKARYHRWARYVGDDAIGQKIRAYGIANPNKSIVIRDKRSGAMMFLRHAMVPSFASFCKS